MLLTNVFLILCSPYLLLFLYWQCLVRDPSLPAFLLIVTSYTCLFCGFNFLLTQICSSSYGKDSEFHLSVKMCFILPALLNCTELFSFSILKLQVHCLPTFLFAFENSAYNLIFLCK